MSDTVIIQVFSGFTALMGTVFTGLMTYMIARHNAAEKRQREVDLSRDRKLEVLRFDTNASRILLAYNVSLQLRINAAMAEQLAVTTEDPQHIEAARRAGKVYEDHMNGQTLEEMTRDMEARRRASEALPQEPKPDPEPKSP